MTVPQAFDSLLAKLIITGASRTEALERARRALDECVVGGMPTVLPFDRVVVRDPAFTAEPFSVHTRWIETEFENAIEPWSGPAPGHQDGQPLRERITVEVGGKRLEVVLPAGLGVADGPASTASARRPARGRRAGAAAATPASGDDLVSPMQGTITKIVAAEGDQVSAGDTIVVLEAMKMEQPLTAHKDGTVTGLGVEIGQTVSAGAVICKLEG
jgi:acetyl-CoA/propionyl-CoA carboxylase biotin carboxyl carrier protein